MIKYLWWHQHTTYWYAADLIYSFLLVQISAPFSSFRIWSIQIIQVLICCPFCVLMLLVLVALIILERKKKKKKHKKLCSIFCQSRTWIRCCESAAAPGCRFITTAYQQQQIHNTHAAWLLHFQIKLWATKFHYTGHIWPSCLEFDNCTISVLVERKRFALVLV